MVLTAPVSAAQGELRSHYSLNDGWRFTHLYTPNAEVVNVDLPHVWSKEQCRYSTASYTRQLHIPHLMRGKRLFLRFGGVMSVANVLVNGKFVGEHRGGYTAFTLEITDKVRYGEKNNITVVVSNNIRSDVFPISTEHNLSGGIYRDVELLVTNKNIISPIFHSSDGVLLKQKEANTERATGVVTLHLSALDEGAHQLTVRFIAPDGYEVYRYTVKAGMADKQSGVDLPYNIP